VRVCGIVTVRQQPATAKGTVFVTLEDETGSINVIVWKSVREHQRAALLHSRLLAVSGTLQSDRPESGGLRANSGDAVRVRHVVARELRDQSAWLGRLAQLGNPSRDFR
jgi:error-prone DNA polymerase